MGERWTPIYDRLFDPGHHLAKGPACRRWAWLDLCHMARWEDRVRLIRGRPIHLKRGELVASLRYLAERWQWSVKKVRVFIETLEDPAVRKLESVRETPKGTVYRVVAYDEYANPGHAEGHTRGTPPPESPNSSSANALGVERPEEEPKIGGTPKGTDSDTGYRHGRQEVAGGEGHTEGHRKGHGRGTPGAQTTTGIQQVTSKSDAREGRGDGPLPAAWSPHDMHAERATSLNLDVGAEAEAFRSHHLSHGNERSDWNHAFYTWLGNATKYGPAPSASGSSQFKEDSRVLTKEQFEELYGDRFDA